LSVWTPLENRGYKVELDKDGMPIRIIKKPRNGNKTVKDLIRENIENPKREDLTAADKTRLKALYRY